MRMNKAIGCYIQLFSDGLWESILPGDDLLIESIDDTCWKYASEHHDYDYWAYSSCESSILGLLVISEVFSSLEEVTTINQLLEFVYTHSNIQLYPSEFINAIKHQKRDQYSRQSFYEKYVDIMITRLNWGYLLSFCMDANWSLRIGLICTQYSNF